MFTEGEVPITCPTDVKSNEPGNPYREVLSTVDFLIKTGCFVRKEKYSFHVESS
jgi:hypothetical protein